MTDRLTIRDLDPNDLDVLRQAASERGVSLSGYVRGVLHERAGAERHRRLFAAVAAQHPGDLPTFDAVAEVRAARDEQDARDDQRGVHA